MSREGRVGERGGVGEQGAWARRAWVSGEGAWAGRGRGQLRRAPSAGRAGERARHSCQWEA